MSKFFLASLATISLSLAALGSAQAARIDIPAEVIVQAVDGKDLGLQLFGSREYLDLNAGSHRIAVKYKDLFEMMGDNHEVVASDPVLLAFVLPADGSYRLAFDKPRDLTTARAFAKDPKFQIVDANGKPLATESMNQEQQESLWQAAVSLGAGSSTTDAARSTAITTATATTVAVTANAEQATPIAAPAPEQKMAAEQLHYWWTQADSATRASFLKAIGVNP